MTETVPLRILNTVPCFSDLDANALGSLLDSAREMRFAKGELLLQEGEECPGLFVLQSGSVKLFRTSPSGDEQIIRVITPGGCFECAPLFDNGPNPVSAQTLEESTAVFIPATGFRLFLGTHPEVITKLAPILAMRLRDLLNTIEDFSFRSVSSRINKMLLQLGRRDDDVSMRAGQPLTQHQLSCIVGCSRQVLNSHLRDLVRQGIIRMQKRQITVLKPEELHNKAME